MMRFSRKLMIALVSIALLLPASAYAWTAYEKNIKVRFAQIQLYVNHKKLDTKAEPFIYNGNVYAPVATIANALDVQWIWDNTTPAVHVLDKKYQLLEENYVSGKTWAYPLGNDYYFYYDFGLTEIWKRLKYQNKEIGKQLEVPNMDLAGHEISETFFPYIEAFIDLDRDGKKEELLIERIFYAERGEGGSHYERHLQVLKFLEEKDEFETIGSLFIDDGYSYYPGDNTHYNYHTSIDYSQDKKLYITYNEFNEDRTEHKPVRIDIYEWQEDHLEKTAVLEVQ